MVVPLAISLAPLIRSLPVDSVIITTEQSLSGGGRKTLENSRRGNTGIRNPRGVYQCRESELKRILGEFNGNIVEPLTLPIEVECRE